MTGSGTGAKPEQRNREVEATRARDLVDRGHRGLGDRPRRHPRGAAAAARAVASRSRGIRFATVDMGTGIPVFGAGWFGVRARHGERGGRVPAVHADDHRAGDDRRARDLRRAEEDRRGGDRRRRRRGRTRASSAWASRSREVRGTLGDPIDIAPKRQDRLLLQVQPVAGRQGLRHRARARPRATGTRRRATAARSTATLDAARLAARPDRRHPGRPDRRRLQFAQVATTQHGEVVERVPADWLLPFVHQRYDDLSVLGKKD